MQINFDNEVKRNHLSIQHMQYLPCLMSIRKTHFLKGNISHHKNSFLVFTQVLTAVFLLKFKFASGPFDSNSNGSRTKIQCLFNTCPSVYRIFPLKASYHKINRVIRAHFTALYKALRKCRHNVLHEIVPQWNGLIF